MSHTASLFALSPLDGRYAAKLDALRPLLSEFGLIHHRVIVEARWLAFLAERPEIAEIGPLSAEATAALARLAENFSEQDAAAVKRLEATTNHDVKACEYFLREQLSTTPDADTIAAFLHFACTSEDINNVAYALMLQRAREQLLLPAMTTVEAAVAGMATELAAAPMLSRTHGQPASPTTMGKEMRNVAARLTLARSAFSDVTIFAKFNGAVGNFAAHRIAYPDVDWPQLSAAFIESFELTNNPLTTQIEPHDWVADYANALSRYATVLIDFCRDLWGYISLGFFRQRTVAGEVGSSTMPHKVNPIDFENAEGNLGIAHALLDHLAGKLPISRWQRDLSDSTALRNLGPALGHLALALASVSRGLGKLVADENAMAADLAERWEVLAEAVQTVMRRYGLPEPYEQLKALTRGKPIDRESLQRFIKGLALPDAEKQKLLELTPLTYLGYSESLAT
ncbi:MAG: adenylosuccinate lyase [Pseudomonadota bacterium]